MKIEASAEAVGVKAGIELVVIRSEVGSGCRSRYKKVAQQSLSIPDSELRAVVEKVSMLAIVIQVHHLHYGSHGGTEKA
jgi:hypothetical protein